MYKQLSLAATTLFSFFFLASASYGQEMVCWQLDHGLLGISPIVYKMSVQDLGNNNFMLVGTSSVTTVTNPPQTSYRVVQGGAVVMDDETIEVSMSTSDINISSSSETQEESLSTTTAHLLLDNTLNGKFHTVYVRYPQPSDTNSTEPTTSFSSGTVTLIDCE